VCNTLKQTLFRRNFPKDVIIYSDQDSQYCCADFKQLLLKYGLGQSMRQRENRFDNAVVESFFRIPKAHIIYSCYYKRGNTLIKHYLNILEFIIIVFVVIQPIAGYRQNNMNNNFTKTIK